MITASQTASIKVSAERDPKAMFKHRLGFKGSANKYPIPKPNFRILTL